jgi:4-hydroxythreonine-4-phosphate dehydrogenase
MGDPAGIGPETALKTASERRFDNNAEFVLYGSPNIIAAAAELAEKGEGEHCAFNIRATGNLKFDKAFVGTPNPLCGAAALAAVRAAVEDALTGEIDAVITAPMCKASVNMAGIDFTGHTEFIASLCGVPDAEIAMRQSAGKLRVAFVTTHIPIRDVPDAVTPERIAKTAELLVESIVEEGVPEPLIAIAGLNPHAGEDGFMGREDEEIVKPAAAKLQKSGFRVEGPFPSDTLFVKETLARFDGVLAMYHDQGHIPFKMLAFDKGVNSTLGLPIIRTSPDHGAAFPIAWGRGRVDMGSILAAAELAVAKAKTRRARE